MNEVRTTTARCALWTSLIAASGLMIGTTASAAHISKTFEFGPGAPHATSVLRSFAIPNGLAVVAVVKYQRLTGGKTNVPITIELREPDISPGVEGPIVDTRFVTATTVEQTATIQSLPSNRGCSKPWRIRVKFAGTGDGPAAPVFGVARIDFDGQSRSISTQGGTGFIGKGTSTVIDIGGSGGFDQGQLAITANWNHMIGVVPGPEAVKLSVQLGYLINNNPNQIHIAGSTQAYSSNEARNLQPKFNMLEGIDEDSPGQWKLFVSNESPHDAFIHSPTVTFIPKCP